LSHNQYTLDPSTYTLYNALLWGNFRAHCDKICKVKWGGRVVHVICAALEFLPVISQIISLFEMAVMRCCGCMKSQPSEPKISVIPEKLKKSGPTIDIEAIDKQKTDDSFSLNDPTPDSEKTPPGEPGRKTPPSPDSEEGVNVVITPEIQLVLRKNNDPNPCNIF